MTSDWPPIVPLPSLKEDWGDFAADDFSTAAFWFFASKVKFQVTNGTLSRKEGAFMLVSATGMVEDPTPAIAALRDSALCADDGDECSWDRVVMIIAAEEAT